MGIVDSAHIIFLGCGIHRKNIDILKYMFRKGIMLASEKRGESMISYENFWKTIGEKRISTYALIYKHGIMPSVIQRLRDGRPITTKTLNTLCAVLDCKVSDIIEFLPEEEESEDYSPKH